MEALFFPFLFYQTLSSPIPSEEHLEAQLSFYGTSQATSFQLKSLSS